MGYTNANGVLPPHLLREVQRYIDGVYLYVPRKDTAKQPWGARTGIRQTLLARNSEIVAKRRAGFSVADLAQEYFLSAKAIYKIVNAAERG